MPSKYAVALPCIGVTQETADALQAIADADGGRSLSSVIRAAVLRYVEHQAAG